MTIIKAKQRLSAGTSVMADVDTKEAAKIITKVFADHSIKVTAQIDDTVRSESVISVKYRDPVSKKSETFTLSVNIRQKSAITFDSMGGSVFNFTRVRDLEVGAPDFAKLSGGRGVAFQKWADKVDAAASDFKAVVDEVALFTANFADAMGELDALVAKNKLIGN